VLQAWSERGRIVRVDGYDVFVVERGDARAPVLAILHGFPSWSADFALVLDALAERFRIVVHDHVGFGLSAKPTQGFGYSLMEQADVALGVWRALGIERLHLVAHDYGTSVATELLARRERKLLPLEIVSVTLTNGSVHLELAQRRIAQHIMGSALGPAFVRAMNKRLFLRNMQAILRKPVAREHLDGMWAALHHEDGHLLLPRISAYQRERTRFAGRWIGALTRLDIPAHVLWATDDPIAVPAIGDKLASEIPNARHTRLAGVGHYPMLEDPVRWSAAVMEFCGA
jgi:pimeloyl-ACP methyl ester carboxylesterase